MEVSKFALKGDLAENWRNRLRTAIEQQGLGDAWKRLSTEAGLGETFVRDVLDYQKDPSVGNLAKLCGKLGISAGSILDFDPPSAEQLAPTDLKMDIRVWLKLELEKSGKTQARLADHLKRDKGWVSLLFSCRRDLKYHDAVAIARFIGVSLPGPVGPAILTAQHAGLPPARMNSSTVGQRIRTARQNKSMSISALARELGVSRPSITDWEKDKWPPQPDKGCRSWARRSV